MSSINTREILRNHHVDVAFKGDGGDELFHRNGPVPDVTDLLCQNGIGRRALAVAMNDAIVDDWSLWKVIRNALRSAYVSRPRTLLDIVDLPQLLLVSQSIRAEAQDDLTHWHPSFREIADLPPGKSMQAYRIVKLCERLSMAAADSVVEIAPLLSQPVIELVLQIPLYVLRAGGRDRELARKAFESLLPQEIRLRRSKSVSKVSFEGLVLKNKPKIRELLRRGYLVEEGILDPRALNETLDTDERIDAAAARQLISFSNTEVWVRSFLDPLEQQRTALG